MSANAEAPTQRTSGSVRLGVALLAVVAVPLAAMADGTLTPYAKLTYDHDTNIFAFPTASADLPPGTLTAEGDQRQSYVGGADVTATFGRQKFLGKVEGRRINYDHFSDLDHGESLFSGELDYQLGHAIDGVVRFRQDRRMAPFTDRLSDTLAVETERNAFVSMRFAITPEWSVQPDVGRRDLASPLPLFPDLRLREDTYGASVTYLGLGPLKVGLDGRHLSGTYTGVTSVPDVAETLFQMTAEYQVTGVSLFKGALGHTRRDQGDAANNISDVTGMLGYRRQLTGKTAIDLQFSRAVNSYVTAGSSEIDTRWYVAVDWQATRKLDVSASFASTRGVFVGDAIPGIGVIGRHDRFATTRVTVDYQPLRWLSVKPYFQYQNRDSNDALFTFTGTLVGVEVLVRRMDGER